MRTSIFAVIAVGLTALLTPGVASAEAIHNVASSTPIAPRSVINHSCGSRQDPNKLPHKNGGDSERTTIGKAVIALRGGQDKGFKHDYHWARITGGSVGDTVWLDWADIPYGTTPHSWHLCGPYKIHSGHDAHTLAVNNVYDNPHEMGRVMRACGHHAGKTKCTVWE
jgi:hypothetical protein